MDSWGSYNPTYMVSMEDFSAGNPKMEMDGSDGFSFSSGAIFRWTMDLGEDTRWAFWIQL